jgi:hypothetical protein
MRIIAMFALFHIFTIPVSLHAQSFGGVGTRAEGMGGAFVAVADDASAAYWNPAGIATGAIFDLQAAGGESNLFIGAALPMLGASYYRTRGLSGLPTVSSSPDRQTKGSGEVPVRTLKTTNFGVTVVQTIVPGVVIGTTARILRGGVDEFDTRTTVDLDAGAMVSAWNMRFGLTARNLREPEFHVEEGVVRLKRHFRVGGALAPRSLPTGVHGPFTVAVDADLTKTWGVRGARRHAAAGGEYWLAQGVVGVRAGARWSTLGTSNMAYSGGLTLRLPRSIHIEGQMTNGSAFDGDEWNVGARITF